jgi:hypothetical protein
MKEDKTIFHIGQAVDRLITVPMSSWCILKGVPLHLLYEEAYKKAGGPLTLTAAQKIIEVTKPGDKIIIATGFFMLNNWRPELDGPIGGASLARALSIGLSAIPVMVSEKTILHTLGQTCNAAGLHSCDFYSDVNNPRRVILEEFPIDKEEARRAASELLDRIKPSALISIERPGANEKGVYHAGRGHDISSVTAKMDYLFEEAKGRGILTIGIGDLGNELGMGYIKEAIKKWVPGGSECTCPCKGGIAADFDPDVAVVCNISNWGAYGVEACLAKILGAEEEIMHDGELEDKLIEEALRAGAFDPRSGLARPFVKGQPKKVHIYIVELLRSIICSRIQESIFTKQWELGRPGENHGEKKF